MNLKTAMRVLWVLSAIGLLVIAFFEMRAGKPILATLTLILASHGLTNHHLSDIADKLDDL